MLPGKSVTNRNHLYYPQTPFDAAKVIEFCCHLRLDVELVARRVLPAAFFGATAGDEVLATTEADRFTFYTFGLSSSVIKKIYNKDLLAGYPQISTLMCELASRPSISQVEADKAA